MVNNRHHIDNFLLERLGDFEQAPDDQAMVKTMGYLSHYQDVIDLKLSATLGQLESQPDEQAQTHILEHPGIQQTQTDGRLHELLSDLEEQPSIGFNPNWAKAKNRKYVSIALTLILTTASIVFNQSINDNNREIAISNEVETNTIVGNSTSDEPAKFNLQSKEQTPVKTNDTDLEFENSLVKAFKNGTVNNLILAENHPLEEMSKYFEITSSILPLKDIKTFDWTIEPIHPTEEKHKSYQPPRPIALPIQIGLWTGISMENRMNASVHSDKVHKDYMSLYEQGDAKKKRGSSLYLSVHYQMSRRFSVQAGYQYSSTSAQTHMQYVYTDIPVYDTTGKILGYITKPPSASQHFNETLTSKSSTSNIPIQLDMAFIAIGKWSVHGGLGINLQIKRQIEFSNFNFIESGIDKHKERIGTRINSMANLQIRRQLSSQFTLGLNYQFNPRNLQIKDSNADLKGTLFRSNYQIGLIYTPIIKP